MSYTQHCRSFALGLLPLVPPRL
uniref:Uncharacterized protein n=1 Tax=Arundo donax TaxID=35708 RepID=A0A0A9AG08_ARUDO